MFCLPLDMVSLYAKVNCSQCVSNPAHFLICHLRAHLLPITPQPQYKYAPSQAVAQDMCLVSIIVLHSGFCQMGNLYFIL